MAELSFYPRFAESSLKEALEDSPVVLVHGPRQCGKSTLAKMLGKKLDYSYISFDNEVQRERATSDPIGFVDSLPDRVILDEVQRVAEIFTSIKAAVDENRKPGRFLLTGSSNVLLVPKLSDSLAGRMDIQRLHPLSQCEIAGKPSAFLDSLFAANFPTRSVKRLEDELIARVVTGGYPPALQRSSGRRRNSWYRSYIDTLVQRDVRELARISELDALPKLLSMAASQTAQLFNLSELASAFQLSRPTIKDYLVLLENIFLLERLSPWHNNRASRLVKTPKLHIGDSGLACNLLGLDENALGDDRKLLGLLLETFVYQELRRMASWHGKQHNFYHYRDRNQVEVDIVIQRGVRQIAGVEVKAGATVTSADFRGLRKLKQIAGKSFVAGIVLYDGKTCGSFGEKLFAVPIRMLWELM